MQNARLNAALKHKAAAQPAKTETARESSGQSERLALTVFPSDSARIMEIIGAMAKRGKRITASHAVRLALRAVQIDGEKFAALLNAMSDEDGRSLRHERKG